MLLKVTQGVLKWSLDLQHEVNNDFDVDGGRRKPNFSGLREKGKKLASLSTKSFPPNISLLSELAIRMIFNQRNKWVAFTLAKIFERHKDTCLAEVLHAKLGKCSLIDSKPRSKVPSIGMFQNNTQFSVQSTKTRWFFFLENCSL